MLNGCRRARAAEYCHGNRRGCLKGTRDAVLNEIESWAKDFDQSQIFWLNGLAGTGKSTIAQTIAERLFAEGLLGASFFCSRDFEDRSNLHFIFPTLAFQLAHKYPDFRSYLVPLLLSNPDVVHESLSNQIQRLITEPLQKAGISTVIIIDALDECKDDEPSSAILSVLGRVVDEVAEVKFLITGRPEPRIKTGFRLPLLADSTDIFVLHNVQPLLIENDIRMFLKHELSELAQRRRLEEWPTEKHINILCSRAAGLFVYAVATVRFLGSSIHLPQDQLDEILKVPGSTTHEGRTRLSSETTLDSLYRSILQTAFSEGDPVVDSKVRAVIGTVVMVVNPLPPPAIAELIRLKPEEVALYLELIQSLLPLGEDSNQPVKPLHKSFPDFITDPSRCDTRFLVSPGRLSWELGANCLRLMIDELEQNLLSLPEYALNSEVEDLQARIDGRISTALQYACRSWYNHVAEIEEDVADVTPHLRLFLEKKFLGWLEVLSVLGDLGNSTVGLEKLIVWLQEVCLVVLCYIAYRLHGMDQVAKDSQLLDTAQDCLHFVTGFFEPINVSAAHIYHSALELCPSSSIVRRLYYDQCHGITRFPRVVIGTPDSWDPTMSLSGREGYENCIWSPCGRFIAAQTQTTIEIRNHITLELLAVLQYPKPIHVYWSHLAYSPDGRSLACVLPNCLVIWDIQTGGVVQSIGSDVGRLDPVWSFDGRTVAAVVKSFVVKAYDVASGTQLFEIDSEERILHLWACGESFRILTESPIGPDYEMPICEIGPTCTRIESLREISPQSSEVKHPPYAYRAPLAGCRHSVSALVTGYSHHLLSYTGDEIFGVARLSSDGSYLATLYDNGFRVWKYSFGSFVLFGEYPLLDLVHFNLEPHNVEFSPTSTSILSRQGNILQVWRLDGPPATPQTRRQLAAISRSGHHIATAHESQTTVTIIDLQSQAPSQSINLGGEIEGLAITGNILLVAISEKVMGWVLTEEGTVAGHGGSIWTTTSPFLRRQLLGFRVQRKVAVIGTDDIFPFIYDTDTGDVLDRTHQPYNFDFSWISFYATSDCREYHYLRYPGTTEYHAPVEDGWLVSHTTTGKEGWVMDPEGRHRFWVPVEWRTSWHSKNWHHDITTLFIGITGQPIMIKF